MLTIMGGSGLPAAGDPFMGGFFAGVIDSTQPGSIPAADANQVGERYALIDLGRASQTPYAFKYKNVNSSAPAACKTVWDGLGATKAMVAAGSSTVYPAAWWADGYSVPNNGASDPYIPAMWEWFAAYWNLKPFTSNNFLTADSGSTFPGGAVQQGYDPVSDPQRPTYTTTVPSQTSVAAFQTPGAQSYDGIYDLGAFWTATEYDSLHAWMFQSNTTYSGALTNSTKTLGSTVRLFRRLPL